VKCAPVAMTDPEPTECEAIKQSQSLFSLICYDFTIGSMDKFLKEPKCRKAFLMFYRHLETKTFKEGDKKPT
jgi:hypothetical protein